MSDIEVDDPTGWTMPARQRLEDATKRLYQAQDEHALAEAEVIRLSLLELAKKRPELTGISYETESVFDDEGHYFNVSDVRAIIFDGEAEGEEVDAAEEEINEILLEERHSTEALGVLCGSSEALGGEVTIKHLRGVSF